MFSAQFLSTPTPTIVSALQEQGVFAIEDALDGDAVDRILEDVDDLRFSINANRPPNVVFRGQTFANHFLASSRTAFELMVHERVLSVLREGLGPVFRMVGKRVYETRSDHYMQFHSDTGIDCEDPRRLDTIVFIFYLNDVSQGEWEIIEGSHLWGETMVGSKDNDAVLLAREDVKVTGFKMPKGSLVIYNGRTLHRARMFHDPDWARRSLFFQVNRNARDGEPVLINAGFIRPDLSAEARMFLGFDQAANMAPFPRSAPKFLPHGGFRAMDEYLAEALPLKRLAFLQRRREAGDPVGGGEEA